MIPQSQALAQRIEHTNLSPIITGAAVELLLAEAQQYSFGGVCLPPYWVKKARYDLGQASSIRLVTVVGFPLGYQRSEVKAQEIRSALRDGADDLDVVINISAVKHNAFEWIKPELAQFSQMIHEEERILKVIIETAYLNEEEIKRCCEVCAATGVDYVKTSTGFAPAGGASVEAVQLMRQSLPASVGIKASGGIRTLAQAQALIAAGADLLGTSSGIAILEELSQ